MADEATLRIVIKDEGGTRSPDDGPPERPEPPARQFAPTPAPREFPAQAPARQPATQEPQLPPTPAATVPAPSRSPQPPPERYRPVPRQEPSQATPSSSFNPVTEAQKMREAEIRKEQIKATYESMYGSAEKTKGAFDLTLDIAQKMRGTLGGTFGTLIGAVLDVVAAVREAEPAPKSSARVEAERRNLGIPEEPPFLERASPQRIDETLPATPQAAQAVVREVERPRAPAATPATPTPNAVQSAASPSVAAVPAENASPAPQSRAIIDEARLALQALGNTQKEANLLLAEVMRTATRTFGTVQEVIQAAYIKPQPAPAEKPSEPVKPQPAPAEKPSEPVQPEMPPVQREQIPAVEPRPQPVELPRERAERPESILGRERLAKREEPPAPQRPESILGRERTAESPPETVPQAQQPTKPSEQQAQPSTDAVQDFIMRDNEIAQPKPQAPAAAPEKSVQDFIMRDNDVAQPVAPKAEPSSQIPTALPAPPGAGDSAPIATAAPVAPAAAAPVAAAPVAAAPVAAAPVAAAPAAAAPAAAAPAAAAPAAAMAGPAAIAVAAVVALQALRENAMGAVRAVGSFANAVASADADPSIMVGNIGEGTKAVSDKLFYLSPALGIFGSVVGEATSSLGGLMKAIDGTASRYGDYNPQIAVAQAMGEIRQTIGDLQRAQTAGPELARYLQVRSDLQQQFEETKIKILMKILPLVSNMLKILEVIMPAGENVATAVEALMTPFTALVQIANMMLNIQQDERIEDPDDPATVILNDRVQIP